jgi:3-methyladenine DNA glycosylase AlkD
VKTWGDCDDFCVHALGSIVLDYPELFDRVLKWCEDSNYVVRRAAAVSLIYSIRKSCFDSQKVFMISDHLMKDEHYLVLKGYGWMLKEYSVREEKAVEDYLRKNVHDMPRLAYRYAVEKLDKGVKRELMSL